MKGTDAKNLVPTLRQCHFSFFSSKHFLGRNCGRPKYSRLATKTSIKKPHSPVSNLTYLAPPKFNFSWVPNGSLGPPKCEKNVSQNQTCLGYVKMYGCYGNYAVLKNGGVPTKSIISQLLLIIVKL